MNSDLIYHEDKIQRDSFIVYLYILRLPTQPQEYQQLQEIIKKKKIKVIYNLGIQSLTFENVQVRQQISNEQVIENMQEELIKQQSNIGLMCSKKCEQSLQIYFHYMIKIEKRTLQDFKHNLFEDIYSLEQLKQQYEEINKLNNISIFNYDLLNTNSNIVSQISSVDCQSQNISNGQLIQIQKETSQNENPNILGLEDQVQSEFLSVSSINPPKYFNNQQDQKNSQQLLHSTQHKLKFEDTDKDKYKLPQSIPFIRFIPKDDLKCFQ